MRTRLGPARLLLLFATALGSVAVAPQLAGAATRTGATHPLYPLPAPAVQPEPCPPPPMPPGPPPRPLGAPKVAEAAIPFVSSVPRWHSDLRPLRGKGIWVTDFPGDHLNLASIVATAHGAGLSQIWVRTGSSFDGYYARFLPSLVADAHRAGLFVIAWDFPTLSNPRVDALRATRAFAAGADGFSPDIESQSEGTYLTSRRVAYYLSLVRAAAGTRPVVATVMPPTSYWIARYPYESEAKFVDAFAPMVYWSCTEPGSAVARAVDGLKALRPVSPIGQDYNMAAEGGRHGLPSGLEIWRFLDVAHQSGSIGASLYDLETGGGAQLRALGDYPWTAPARRAGTRLAA